MSLIFVQHGRTASSELGIIAADGERLTDNGRIDAKNLAPPCLPCLMAPN